MADLFFGVGEREELTEDERGYLENVGLIQALTAGVDHIPFSTLPDGVGPAIAAATHRVLRVGGAFLVYQFSDRARDFMARHFRHIDSGFDPLNVLPCKLFWGWKRADD